MEERRYAQLVETLREEIAVIEQEVRAMEESGGAERHPEKHARAVKKIEEINEQMEALHEAVEAAGGER